MITRYHITVGARTTAGGTVISADSYRWINDAQVAYADAPVACPACNTVGVIKPDGPRLSDTYNGKEVALSDDLCICKCDPPPRLIANQDFSCQEIDADWLAGEAATVAQTASKLNTTGNNAATALDGIPLVLLNPDTEEPYKHRPYRVELNGTVIEGTTDQNGATRPLTAAERAAVVRWHVDDENAPA